MTHPVLSAFRDLELDPRDDARARAFGAALDEVARDGIDGLAPSAADELRDLLRTLVRSARARWDDALVVRILDEWLPRESALGARVQLLLDRAAVTTAASVEESRVVEAWQAVLAMAKKAGDASAVARAEHELEERKQRKAGWSKRVEALRAAAAASSGNEQARAMAAAAEEALRFGKASGKKKSQGLVEANAETELERAFDLAPSEESLARLLANVFDARRRFADRTRVLRRHAASTENGSAASVRVGYALARERHFAESARAFRDGGVLESSDVLALDRLAASALAADEVDLACEALETLAARAASSVFEVEALALLVHVLGTRRGRFDLVHPVAERLRSVAPGHPALSVLDSAPAGAATAPFPSNPGEVEEPVRTASQADAPERSFAAEPLAPRELEAFRARLRRDPSDAEARGRLKGHYRVQGPPAALVELLRYELSSADSTEGRRAALVELCEVHRTTARNDAALIGSLSQLVAMDPLDRAAARELAELLEKHGRWRDALVVFGKIAESESDAAAKLEATRTLARRWSSQMAQAPQAAEAWERVLQLAPSDDEAFAALREILTKRHAHAPLATLLEQRASASASPEARHGLLLEAAKLYAERLGRPEAAVAHLRAILGESPANLAALETLERIADARRDFALLAEVLEGRIALTQDEGLRVNALQRLAALYAERLQDPVRSLATWRRVLELVPTHARAGRAVRDALVAAGDIAELERTYVAAGDWDGFVSTLLAASEKESEPSKKYALVERASEVLAERHPSGEAVVRVLEKLLALDPTKLEPARKLVGMHEAEKRFGRLAALYEALLVGSTEEGERDAWRSRLVDLHLERVPDAARAWRFALERFEASAPTPATLDALDAVARRLGRWAEFAEAIGRARGRVGSSDVFLRARLAHVQARELGSVDDAVVSLEALWRDGEDVFADLESLLRSAGRTDALRDVYERRLGQVDAVAAVALLGQWALLEEEVFGESSRAEALLERITKIAPHDVNTLRALLRFAERRNDDERAEPILSALVACVPVDERAKLRVRRAEILSARAASREAAWTELRSAFEEGVTVASAVALTERLSAEPAIARDVLGVLIEEYTRAAAPRDLAHALGRASALCTSDAERHALELRRAKVLGDELGERAEAEALAKTLVREAPAVDAHWEALARFVERREDLAGPYAVAARSEVTREPSALPASLRAALAAEVASLLEANDDRANALEMWCRAVESDASAERARDRGLALVLESGHGAAMVNRFFRAAYGDTPGAQTLGSWAQGLRAQGAVLEAADRVRARMQFVGFQEELACELEADLEAGGADEALVEALERHAECTASVEVRCTLVLRRCEVLFERLKQAEHVAVLVAEALASWPGHRGFEVLAARVAEDVAGERTNLWRALATSARAAGRLEDEAVWLERIALATTDRAEENRLVRVLLERDTVRADAERASRLFERALALDPGDAALRSAWLDVLRPLGRAAAFVRFAEDAYLRERTEGSRAALLHGAEVCAAVLDDNARACAMLDLLRDDEDAGLDQRVEASSRALRLRRPHGASRELVASLERHLALPLEALVRADALRERAASVEAIGGEPERVYACWRAVVDATPDDLEARERSVTLALSLERPAEAVVELSALVASARNDEEKDRFATERARVLAERVGDARASLDSLEGFPKNEASRAAFAVLRAEIAERAQLTEDAVAALRELVDLESSTSARAALYVRLARARLGTDEGRVEAVGLADRALEDDPVNRDAADVLRSLLAVPEARAAASSTLVARLGASTDAPELLVAALEARAATHTDLMEAVALLGRAAQISEDQLGDGSSALRLRVEAFARAPAAQVSSTLEEAMRLARALGAVGSVVDAVEARLDAHDDPAFAMVCDAAMVAARRLAVEPRRALAWADVRLGGREATRELLEERLEIARETRDPRVVLEALERVETVWDETSERLALEAERLTQLDLAGAEPAISIACLFRLVELGAGPERVDDLRGRLRVAGDANAALELEERVRSREGLSSSERVSSFLLSAEVASEWRGDAVLALTFLEGCLACAPEDARLPRAVASLQSREGVEREVLLALARIEERSARARGEVSAVVDALERQRGLGDGADPILDEAIAEARLARGDSNDALALAWVSLLKSDPAHGRACQGLTSLASTDARLLAADALSVWLRTQTFDDDATAALCEFTAQEYVRAGRRGEAAEFLLRAYRANPAERAESFPLLDELLAERGPIDIRVELHRERAQESLDSSARFERLLVLADLEEQRDGDARQARATYEEALEVGDFDLAAVAALERVYAAQEDWRALFELLARRLERADQMGERHRIRRRLVDVARERLASADEAVDVLVGWLGDERSSVESRGEAGAFVVALLADERVRVRVVEECGPLLASSDGDARTRVLEAAAELEATRADAAPRWLALARHVFDVRGDSALAVKALSRAFAGDPAAPALRETAREFGARLLDWADIARGFEEAMTAFEPWEQRDAVLALVEMLDEDAGDPRRALKVLESATASPDADDALHVKADELSMILADWEANVRALRRRSESTLDGEVRSASLRRAATVALEELGNPRLALSLLEKLLEEGESEADLSLAVWVAREVGDPRARRALLPRLLDARGWSGVSLERDALELATLLAEADAPADEVISVLERALDGGAPRPRLVVELFAVLRRSRRFDELVRALEAEAERCFEPIHAAPIHDERSVLLEQELHDEHGAFAAACAACDALPSEERFGRVVALCERFPSLLEEALRFVDATPGAGREDAQWTLLVRALSAFEGEALLEVSTRLGERAWSLGRPAVAADAWLVALKLAPENDPFVVEFDDRLASFGEGFLDRYVAVLARVEDDALDPFVAATAALRRGAVLVERLGRPAEAIPSLVRADEAAIDPLRSLGLLVRALESGDPTARFAEALERLSTLSDGADRGRLLARAALAREAVGEVDDSVIELAARAFEESSENGATVRPLLVRSLGHESVAARAAEILDAVYRSEGDGGGRLALRRGAIERASDAGVLIAAELAFVDLALDLHASLDEALVVATRTAQRDPYADDALSRFEAVARTNVSATEACGTIASALRSSKDGAAGLARFASALLAHGAGLGRDARLDLARACVEADSESVAWVTELERLLLEGAPTGELADVLVARARLEADEDIRLSCLRRALALATDVLADVAVGDRVLEAWAGIEESAEYFAARVSFAEARGKVDDALDWSRRGAEECFDAVLQERLWREHAERAVRASAWSEALRAFEQLLMQDPADREIQRRQRDVLRRAADFEGLARALDDHALTVDDDRARVALLLELAHVVESELGDLERSRDALRRAVETGASRDDVLVAARAFAARSKGDSWLVEILEVAADMACGRDETAHGVAFLLEAADVLASRLGDAGGALERLERARAIDLSDTRVASRLVHLARELGRWELAIDVLEQQVERDPSRGSFADLVATADASRESWLIDRALEVWRRLGFDGGELEDQLYEALLRDERYDEARVFLEERTDRLRGAGRSADARDVVARALAKAHERSIDLLELAVKTDPDNEALLVELAARLVDDGRADDARDHLEHALHVVPPGDAQCVLHVMLGRIARDRWDLDRARSHFEAARTLRPSAPLPLRELMLTCQEAGESVDALKHGKALLLLPLDEGSEVRRSDALAALARLYEDEGDRAKAAELYARAIESAPGHEEAARGLARSR